MDKKIVEFIQEHYLLTLATSNNNSPYCCNVYYVYDKKQNTLIFSSEKTTKHVQDFLKNDNVAGAISKETKLVEDIKGVQILGVISELVGSELVNAKKMYIKAFPYSKNMSLNLWKMKICFIKMTNNQLGFGKKLFWQE